MTRFYNPNPQFFDDSGKPLSGGSLTFYEPGTTTAKTTYQDYGQDTANSSNVITLDSSGRTATNVFYEGLARVILKDSGGSTVWDKDYCGFENRTAYGIITSASTITGFGVESVSRVGTGQFQVTFTTPAPATDNQAALGTFNGSNINSVNASRVSTTVMQFFLQNSSGTAVDEYPIAIERRIFY